ncbi:Hypothetical protein, putative, partial [Bodo saltans]
QPKEFEFDDVSDGRRSPRRNSHRSRTAVVNVFDVEVSESGSFAARRSRPSSGAATPLLTVFDVDGFNENGENIGTPRGPSSSSAATIVARHANNSNGGPSSEPVGSYDDAPLQSFFVDMGDDSENEH